MWKPLNLLKKIWMLGLWGKLVVAFLALLATSAGVITVTEQPGFCQSCHIMEPYYASWKNSTHAEVNCLECHMMPGLTGHVIGKVNGLAQAIDCALGRMGTKPNATVIDASCLRPECHSKARLEAMPLAKVKDMPFKFRHKGHLDAEVDGLRLRCGTCHSHFEGEEHFHINTQSCFMCHFLKGGEQSERLVQTRCQSCHDVPKEPVQRGDLIIDHDEFITHQASCEKSCHKKQIEQVSSVPETSCLHCHNERKPSDMSSKQLHALHSNGEKVECFSCHGELDHRTPEGLQLVEMLSCQDCHSNTHEAQRTLYTGSEPQKLGPVRRALSPMFMTHVECNACHIERVEMQPGALTSFGTVARATPKACDNCHEAGTGEKFVPFWQKQIRGLYDEVQKELATAEQSALQVTDTNQLAVIRTNLEAARRLMDAVAADGSWGVHNLKYTEAMLRQARNLIRNRTSATAATTPVEPAEDDAFSVPSRPGQAAANQTRSRRRS